MDNIGKKEVFYVINYARQKMKIKIRLSFVHKGLMTLFLHLRDNNHQK